MNIENVEFRAQKLQSYVGTRFEMKDEKGNALGCALPLYLIWPELPKFDFKDIKTEQHFKFVWGLLEKHFKQVKLEEIQVGDVIAIQLPIYKTLHLAIYLGENQIFHCLNVNNGRAERCALHFYEKHIKGVFRWGL